MARKAITGVDGVLGELVSGEASPSVSSAGNRQNTPPVDETVAKSRISAKRPTRLGRPPGSACEPSSPKEKLTVRIDARLAADYRDWSWEERCQLGQLIERALRHYRRKGLPREKK